MLPVHINAMTYALLQEKYTGQTVKEKMAKWMSSIGHKDRPLGLAKENTIRIMELHDVIVFEESQAVYASS